MKRGFIFGRIGHRLKGKRMAEFRIKGRKLAL